MKPSKLSNPNSFHVRDALTRQCALCKAPKGQLCVTVDRERPGRPLPGIRKVHYARTRFCEDTP